MHSQVAIEQRHGHDQEDYRGERPSRGRAQLPGSGGRPPPANRPVARAATAKTPSGTTNRTASGASRSKAPATSIAAALPSESPAGPRAKPAAGAAVPGADRTGGSSPPPRTSER